MGQKLKIAKSQAPEMVQMPTSKAVEPMFKEAMSDVYFVFQETFADDDLFTGKEILKKMRKVLKKTTEEILVKFDNEHDSSKVKRTEMDAVNETETEAEEVDDSG